MFALRRIVQGKEYFASTDFDWKPLSTTALTFPTEAEAKHYRLTECWEKDIEIVQLGTVEVCG